MANHDFTAEEIQEFGEEFDGLNAAKAELERVAQMLEARGYLARAHKVRGVAMSADAQKYLLVQDWEQAGKERVA